jgi:hypothetical protein
MTVPIALHVSTSEKGFAFALFGRVDATGRGESADLADAIVAATDQVEAGVKELFVFDPWMTRYRHAQGQPPLRVPAHPLPTW